MKFGIIFANTGPAATDPAYAAEFAQLAEENGIESLWTVEHVVVPAGYESEYPYSKDGRMPGGEDLDIPDPLIWLTHIAAATRSIKLATGILILPQRNPVVLAKQVATLDRLSGGRVVLGVGVGWLKEEFDALGIPFDSRGARTDDYVEALRVLWREDEPTYHGAFADFERAKSFPKPAQPGGPPIIVGGHTTAAARRAGRLGDGFFPGRGKLEELGGLLDEMRRAAKDAGRDPDAIEVTAGGAMDVEGAKPYAELGVSRLVIPPLGYDLGTLREQLPRFADNVIAKLA
ncbi:MAG TPA: LLM class F420-dependent oxidoreductase [Acidimicrobiales bacterium]|nr:LLM class F420-dependent oxidoreductase [Acidimicrobiales bacterium]